MIHIENQQTAISVDLAALEKKALALTTLLGYEDFDLGIVFVDLATMQEYNNTYKHKNVPTDILSFPFHEGLAAGDTVVAESDDDKNLGDIIMCPEYIKSDLGQWEQTFAQRMDVLLVHGLLHLLGYDHIEDEDFAVMEKEEQRLLAHIND